MKKGLVKIFRLSNKAKKFTAVVLIIFFLFAFVLPFAFTMLANASGLTDTQKKMQETQKKIKEKKDNQKKIISEKEAADKLIMELESNIQTVNGEIQQHVRNIEKLQVDLDNTKLELDKQYELLKKRIRIMYENGSNNYLEILLSSKSITDFLNRYEIIKTIANHDKKLLNKIRTDLEKIETAKANIEEEKKKVELKKADLQVKHAQLEKEQQSRQAILDESKVEIAELEKRYKEYEEMDRRERAAAAAKMKKDTKYTGGTLAWPTPSCYTITSPFGNRFHPVLKTNRFHAGVDIGASYGAEVVAANSGTVIVSKFSTSYGNYIVIDHGGGIATLYAHGSQRLVSEGAKVNKGDAIMKVGSTGLSSGPHLHFEVIVNGKNVDPMSYY